MQNLYNKSGSPPPPYPIYERLFNFIDSTLPYFNVLNTNNDGGLVTSENKITEDLADFFDSKQESLSQDTNTSFRFTNQSQQKTDIGVKLGRGYNANNRKPFCWIEAKRLPTPKGSDRDEREYVIVDEKKSGNGGIQRFKESKHAPNLPYSIMIGYIQDDNNQDYWLSKINEWIIELANTNNNEFWSIKDCLHKHTSDKCDRFLSVHKRKDKSKITLHHYWIKL